MDVQEIVLRLHALWQREGCLVLSSRARTTIGDATIGPTLFFSALGPSPRRVACVEAAYRYRVLLKPAPADGLECFLAGLAAAGIDTRAHDVRFLPEDWVSPALDLRGAGWRVDVDTSPVGRFTYLQEVGGVPTDPVSALLEIDLEGLGLLVQGRDSVDALSWGGGMTHRDLLALETIEFLRYAHEVADAARLTRLLDLVEEESRAALAAGLSAPAYVGVLSCAHLADLLQTRAPAGEEGRSVAQARDLARACARTYLARGMSG